MKDLLQALASHGCDAVVAAVAGWWSGAALRELDLSAACVFAFPPEFESLRRLG